MINKSFIDAQVKIGGKDFSGLASRTELSVMNGNEDSTTIGGNQRQRSAQRAVDVEMRHVAWWRGRPAVKEARNVIVTIKDFCGLIYSFVADKVWVEGEGRDGMDFLDIRAVAKRRSEFSVRQ